jgi:fatty acid desaturase
MSALSSSPFDDVLLGKDEPNRAPVAEENEELPRSGGLDELAKNFARMKLTLTDSRGVKFKEFRRTLSPRYGIVWAQFLAGHLALVVIAVSLLAIRTQSLLVVVTASLSGGVLIGYSLHYLSLFHHAAAHFNLAPNRTLNDLLANVFVGALLGHEITLYRMSHFEHHRSLGTPADTENGYILPFTWKFLLLSSTGLTTLRKLFDRKMAATPQTSEEKTVRRLGPFSMVAALVQAVIVLSALYGGHYAFVCAWGLGLFCFYPLFMGIRLTLEHRSSNARADIDYSQQAHGALSRLLVQVQSPQPLEELGSIDISSTIGNRRFPTSN